MLKINNIVAFKYIVKSVKNYAKKHVAQLTKKVVITIRLGFVNTKTLNLSKPEKTPNLRNSDKSALFTPKAKIV